MKTASDAVAGRAGSISAMKRLGILGFLFFLVKGLLWLTVPLLLALLGAPA